MLMYVLAGADVVAGVGEIISPDDSSGLFFAAMLPSTVFGSGQNELAVYRVWQEQGGIACSLWKP